ncbi:MAG: YncE family protein [Candidatus Gastranaerophilaceae bacterium]|jgi:YVTN family beta-propeller protein
MLKKLIFCLLFYIVSATAFASEIPAPELATLKNALPNMHVRFDGLIELPDGTQYLPVFPMKRADVPDQGTVSMTLPKNKLLKEKPNFLLFKSNLSLFKIIRVPGENPTIISGDIVPLVVKLGLLPQDLLVPNQLEIPTSLRIILGDLVIPVKDSDEFKEVSFKKGSKTSVKSPVKTKQRPKELQDLLNKDFYIINNQQSYINIVSPEVGRPSKQFEIDSIPSDIKLTSNGRYFLVSSIATDKIYIIDAVNGKFIKEIKVGKIPVSIVIADRLAKAFVANKGDSTISVIDLKKMEVVNTVNVCGNPAGLSLVENQEELMFFDTLTNNVYSMKMSGDYYNSYTITCVTSAPNISKVLKQNELIYVLSRTGNTLTVFSPTSKNTIKTLITGEKPVDIAIVKNKIYILNAADDTLSVFNATNYENIKTVELKTNGFPKNFNVLDENKTAIITNASCYEVLVYNIQQDKITKRLPLSITVGKVVVSNKLKQNEKEHL